MSHRMIYLVIALSFIALESPRLASQETRDAIRTRQTAAQKVKGSSHKGTGPAAQRSYHTSLENWVAPDINETETRVSEARAAEQFMELKAQVVSDLIQLEDGRSPDLIQDSIRAPNSDSHAGGISKVNSGNPVRVSRAQIMGDALPAPSKSSAGSNNK